MAQIPASYSRKRGKCIPGQIADTSAYNIDGTCVADKDIPTGVFVASTGEVVEGHKVITQTINAENPNLVGVTIHSHAYSPEWKYDEASAANVMTAGRVWVRADDAFPDADGVKFNQQVFINTSGYVVASGAAGAIGTIFTTCGEFEKFDDIKLIKVQLTQGQFQLPAAGGGA
ncbi:hypothetical protein CPT_Solomon_006 [Klebsiella phage Solomon]|uniref:Capsid decoration protein n=1 Tax=Klebsiella phage Solomon TaxID=2767583 RepID=A0A873WVD1_9CAUD|nr:hypothetical protein CPT_Solomon_006 [Klebsiella phage Solomon]